MREGLKRILVTWGAICLLFPAFSQLNIGTCEIKYAWGTPFYVCHKDVKKEKRKVRVEDDRTITYLDGEGKVSLEFMLGLSAVIHSQNFHNKPEGSAMRYFNGILKEMSTRFGTPQIPQYQEGHILMYRWGKQKPVVTLTYRIESETVVVAFENY
ncbi:MAG: hypothetical protein MH137_06505 [Flavobacteriales bacterium]|nr:hypothetical protein [Flavobacteriales bacterium]